MANLSNINNKFLVTTGGNVLIGQTAAVGSSLLQVTGNATFAGTILIDGVSNYTGLTVKGSGASRPAVNFTNATQGNLGIIFGTEARAVSIGTGATGVIALTLDSSQNATFAGDVGIGTTSFNHFSNAKELLIEGDAVNTNSVVQVISNDNNSSLAIYSGASSTDDPAIIYQNDLRFGSTTDVGLVGYTERMRITSDGNVGIGTTSPSSYTYGSNLAIKNTGSVGITIQSNTTGASAIQFADGDSGAAQYRGGIDYYHSANVNGAAYYSRMDLRTNGAQRITILGSGNVGIGTTSPLYPLNVAIPYAKTSTGTQQFAAIFTTNEAAASAPFGLRIGIIGAAAIANRYAALQTTDYGLADGGNIVMQAAGGNVGIGVTLPTGKLTVETTGNHLHLRNSGAASGRYWNFDPDLNSRLYVVSNTGAGVYIDYASTSWSSTSDESIKENIKPLENVLDKIKDYRCIEYNLIDDETKGKKIGFIAQDWENDFAPIVDKDDEGILGMKYTETIPVLLKAIQELKADNDSLKARIETLENN